MKVIAMIDLSTLPLKHTLKLAYLLSAIVAILIAAVSAAAPSRSI
jgi:hypothetical protein